MILLGSTLFQRVSRALEARDAVHVALNQPQNRDLSDKALANLDTVLMLLMGVVDVTARVAHHALGLPANETYGAAWQQQRKGGWLDKVSVIAPRLAAVVSSSTGLETLTVLRLLRNSVHGEALQGIGFSEMGRSQETLLALPQSDERELLAAIEALGGGDLWGFRELPRVGGLPHGVNHVDPGVLVDRLFEHVILLLNALMRETLVETLPTVNLTAADCLPPVAGASFGPFDRWARTSIRLQLGFT